MAFALLFGTVLAGREARAWVRLAGRCDFVMPGDTEENAGGASAADSSSASRVRAVGDGEVQAGFGVVRMGLRVAAKEACGFAALDGCSRAQIVAGDMQAAWGAGAVLAADPGFTPFPAPQAARERAALFSARGSLARTLSRTRGVAAKVSLASITLFTWFRSPGSMEAGGDGEDDGADDDDDVDDADNADDETRWAAGVCAGSVGVMAAGMNSSRATMLSLAVRHGPAQPAADLLRSAGAPADTIRVRGMDATGGGAGMRRSAVMVLEATCLVGASGRTDALEGSAFGRGAGVPMAAAGFWKAPMGSLFGEIEGAFHWRGGERWPQSPEDGWRIDWALPVLRGVAPGLGLTMRRRHGDHPLPPLEWSRRLALAVEPWSGGRVRLALGSADTEECRALPGANGTRAILRSHRAVIDLDVRMALGRWESLALKVRDSRAHLAGSASALPSGMPGREEEWETEEGSAADAYAWDRGQGSLIRLAVQRQERDSWWCGAALAGVPGDAALAAYVPVRNPAGTNRWRSMASGSWMIEAWAGGKWQGSRTEAILRAMRNLEGATEVVLLLGFARRWTGG